MVVNPVPLIDELLPLEPLTLFEAPATPPPPTVIVYVFNVDNVAVDVKKPPAPPPPPKY